jgi:anti-sigma-K factor RskA
MGCSKYQEMISDYIDGILSPGEQTIIEQHLESCEDCRALRDDMLQLVHFSRHLPLHTPSGAVWNRIQTQVSAERPRGLRARLGAWMARLETRYFSFSLPQLATGVVVLALVTTISFLLVRNGYDREGAIASQPAPGPSVGTIPLSSPDFRKEEEYISRLEESVEQRKPSWSPELLLTFERNLSHVDESLNECRQQLSSNPEDKVSRELMSGAYAEKKRLLERFQRF